MRQRLHPRGPFPQTVKGVEKHREKKPLKLRVPSVFVAFGYVPLFVRERPTVSTTLNVVTATRNHCHSRRSFFTAVSMNLLADLEYQSKSLPF